MFHNSQLNHAPLLPKDPQLFHRPRCTAHTRKQDIDAAIPKAPEGIAEVEGAAGELGFGCACELGEGRRGRLASCGHGRRWEACGRARNLVVLMSQGRRGDTRTGLAPVPISPIRQAVPLIVSGCVPGEPLTPTIIFGGEFTAVHSTDELSCVGDDRKMKLLGSAESCMRVTPNELRIVQSVYFRLCTRINGHAAQNEPVSETSGFVVWRTRATVCASSTDHLDSNQLSKQLARGLSTAKNFQVTIQVYRSRYHSSCPPEFDVEQLIRGMISRARCLAHTFRI